MKIEVATLDNCEPDCPFLDIQRATLFSNNNPDLTRFYCSHLRECSKFKERHEEKERN